MSTGLELLLSTHLDLLRGRRVAFCCNHTAVDARFRHAIDLLTAAGIKLVRLFGPEHGVRATAQDMEGVHEVVDPVSGAPVVSLYGSDAASLRPDPSQLSDVDVLLFDIQDIGARYYTYQATLGFLMEVAGPLGVQVIVLDRPNPINGVAVEGNLVHPGFESFVGAYPLAVRHGLTMGELGYYFLRHCGVSCEYRVLRCEGWRREHWFDQTGVPWVYPSPNMPTLDTAIVYPGMCLFEATNLSEGRGTTRPFHLFGAPWLDPNRTVALCERGASEAGLRGVAFRPAAFIPGFQKHARQGCRGVEVHVTDRDQLDTFLLGLVTLQAAYRSDPERFGWRSEPYEFVADPPAIDLLTGSPLVREAIEADRPLHELTPAWADELAAFKARRAELLLY
jgi:uncharacterized protein YbbC (DUF1343 family)